MTAPGGAGLLPHLFRSDSDTEATDAGFRSQPVKNSLKWALIHLKKKKKSVGASQVSSGEDT